MPPESHKSRLVSRNEPQFQTMLELDKLDIVLALNWYSQNQSKEDSHKYLRDYCTEHNIDATDKQISAQVATMGFVARLLSRRAILDPKSIKWFNNKLRAMGEMEFSPPKKETVQPKKPTQDQIKAALKNTTEQCIADLEAAVDKFICENFTNPQNVASIIESHSLLPEQLTEVSLFFSKPEKELATVIDALMTKKDIPEIEAYHTYSIIQLKKLHDYYNEIINVSTSRPTPVAKKQRKVRVKSPEKQVKKLKFLQEDPELGIRSIDPTKIIGASSVWVYHSPSRVLSKYVAKDDSGFAVKGSTILRYSEEESRSKKLRKPEATIQKLLSCGKVSLRHLFDELTTKDMAVSGRINSKMVILRAVI